MNTNIIVFCRSNLIISVERVSRYIGYIDHQIDAVENESIETNRWYELASFSYVCLDCLLIPVKSIIILSIKWNLYGFYRYANEHSIEHHLVLIRKICSSSFTDIYIKQTKNRNFAISFVCRSSTTYITYTYT